jgi:uncharacterized repeat protein (TIGR01451 family)
MLAAVLMGLVQQAGEVSAQNTFAGADFGVIPCAATAAGPICATAGANTTLASRDVVLTFDVPSFPTTPSQTFQLARVTSTGGANNVTTTLVPSTTLTTPLTLPAMFVSGGQGFVRDVVPAAAGSAACYQLIINNGAARSDFECVIFGLAQGTAAPGDPTFRLNQTSNMTASWQPVAGAAGYIVYGFGTDGVLVTAGTSATLPGTGGLICAQIIPLNAAGATLGASNVGCGFPGNAINVGAALPTLTRTLTPVITASIVLTQTPLPTITQTRTATVAATNTAVPSFTAVPTGTAVPTNTVIPTNTLAPTNTLVPTSSPTNTGLPTGTATATGTATNTPTITSTPTAADLTISKTGSPATIGAGGVVTYTLTVGNAGGTTASPVTVQDNLPPGVTLLSASGTNGFACGDAAQPSNIMACTGGTIPGNSSATITIIVLVNAPCTNLSPFINTAIVNPGLTIFESNFNNNTAQSSTTVLGCPAATPTVTNTGTVTLTRTPTSTFTPTVTNTPVPDLSIDKTGPATVNQNDAIIYTLTVANSGSLATGVVVQDNLPPQVTFVNASGSNGFNCDEAAGVVACIGGLLPQNGSATITIFGVVSGCATPLVNTARVIPVAFETNTANNIDTVASTVSGCPVATATLPGTATLTPTTTVTLTPTVTSTLTAGSLTISKVSVPTQVNAGQPITYVVTVTNNDPNNNAPAVTFVDAIPGGTAFASVQDNDPSTVNDPVNPTTPFSCGEANGEVVCAGGTIPRGGSRSVTISVVTDNPCVVTSPVTNRVALNPNGYQGNNIPGPTATAQTVIIGCIQATATQTVTRTSTPEPTATNTPTITLTRTVTQTATVTLTPAVDLVITKLDAPDPVLVPGGGVNGGNIQYTLVVSNTGSIAANNVTVIDTLENGFNFQCPGAPIAFQCNNSDPNFANGVTFLTAAGDNGFNCSVQFTIDPLYFSGQQEVSCTGGNIGPNGGATISIVVATQPGCLFIMNRAVVNRPPTIIESNPDNNVAFAQTACALVNNTPVPTATPFPTLTPSPTSTNTPVPTGTTTPTITPIPGIDFTKSANPSTLNANNQPVTYTLTIVNSNPDLITLSPSAITDSLPVQVRFVSFNATNGITCGVTGIPNVDEVVVCGNGVVPAGQTATINIITLANFASCSTPSFENQATLFVGGQANQVSNVATVTTVNCTVTPTFTATPTFTPTVTLTATPTTTATPGFDLQVKTGPAAVTAGDAVNYTVTVTNNGPAAATGITLVDNLPPSAQYAFASISPTANGFVCTFNAGPPQTVNCTGGSLGSGASSVITINGSATVPGSCGSNLVNTATILTDNQIAANDSSTLVTAVAACADLEITRTDVSALFGPESSNSSNWRSTVRYTLSNLGPAAITGISFVLNQTNTGNPTLSFGNFAINGAAQNPNADPFVGATVGGFTCSVDYLGLSAAVFTCNGDLPAGGSVILDFQMDNAVFGPAAVTNGTVEWANTVTCTSPTPCSNNTASPANGNASTLVFTDSDPITLAADVDLGATDDIPLGQDLSASSATGTFAGFAYTIFNDSTTPITSVNFSGTLTGTAPRSPALASVSNATWSCTTTQSSWSCSGDLGAETQASNGDNAADAGALGSQVTITLLVPIVGGAAGQTVTFTPDAVTCTGGPAPCSNGLVSPGNTDGSGLLFGPNDDLLGA